MARAMIRIATILLGVVLGLWMVSMSPTAKAATFRGNEDVCLSLSMTAYDVAQMRDAGIPWEVFEPWITKRLAEAKGTPGSHIKDDDDVQFVYGWFKRIWDDPNAEALEFVDRIGEDCMKVPGRG